MAKHTAQPRALPTGFFRTLVVIHTGWAALVGFAVWAAAPNAALPAGHTIWSVLVVALSLIVPAFAFTLSITRSESTCFTHLEQWSMRALALNPIVPLILYSFLAFGMPRTLGLKWNPATNPQSANDLRAVMWNLLIPSAAWFAIQVIPSFYLARGITIRVNADTVWHPHEATEQDRARAITGVCALTGSWAMILGSIWWFSSITPQRFQSYLTAELMMTSFALVPGALLGLALSPLVSRRLSKTRLDKAAPWPFGLTLAAGGSVSYMWFPAGILVATVTALSATWIAERLFTVYPPENCQSCGYSLAGITDPRCPECGHDSEVRPLH